MRVGIIGAGMTGLRCARTLADAGLSPTVFEKSRGLGGRLATRRVEEFRFDHGAQFVTARGESFKHYLAEHAKLWRPEAATGEWFVGAPAMNDLVKPLAKGIDIRLGEQVAPEKERDGGGWWLGSRNFDVVISTVPADQVRNFSYAEKLVDDAVGVAPCWALMVAFDQTPDWPEMWRAREGDLAWIARNSSKPSREVTPDCWVAHASPDWSRQNLEIEKDIAQERLLDLLKAMRGELPTVVYASAHRWRYAMTTAPLRQSHITSVGGSLLIGGDWCLGARVEDAWDSGKAMAEALLSA